MPYHELGSLDASALFDLLIFPRRLDQIPERERHRLDRVVVVVPLDRPGGEVQGTEQYHYRVEAHVTFDFAVRYQRMETREDGDAG